jgi:hypothetical protein
MLDRPLPDAIVRYLYPVIAMVLLSFLVQGLLGFCRLRAIAQRAYPKGYFRLLEAPAGADLPRQAQAVARNFINLFEVPVLFYALVPLLMVFGVRSDLQLGLLWAFVAFRYLHTAIHVTVNVVTWRFVAYLAGSLALLGAWLHFASLIVWHG